MTTRVLFVEASTGGVLGGSLTGLYHLIRGMDRQRFQPAMVLYEPKPIEADLAALDVPVEHVRRRVRLPKDHRFRQYNGYHQMRRIGAIRNGLHTGRETMRMLIEELPAALTLARVVRRSQADVLHLGNGLRANFDGFLAGVLTRTPVVVHVKGFEKYSSRERVASRWTQMLVCMTQAILDYCGAQGLRAPARVVYDAVDESWLQPHRPPAAVRAEFNVPADVPCVGIAGNIQEWKGQRVLVDAMRLVVDTHPDARCLVIGGVHRAGARYAQAVRERTEALGLGDRVHFVGFRDDVVDVINALDVVVHASVRPEPFGRVILEGMLLGKPVVATGAGGVLELIQDGATGFLVPPNDVAALADCLNRLLSDRDRARRVGEQARTWARERFSLTRHVAEMSAIYHALTMEKI